MDILFYMTINQNKFTKNKYSLIYIIWNFKLKMGKKTQIK